MLRVHSTETFATQDGPGIRFVIFTQWCNFRCVYCENPDTIDSKGGEFKTTEEIIKTIMKGKEYFWKKWGVTISWGEPLLQAKELIPIFQQLKKLWIHTSIDTNGSILNNDVKKLLTYTDLVIPDIKHLVNTEHKKITHQNNHNTIKFIKHLEETKKTYRLRHVLVPGRTDKEEHIQKLWEYIGTLKYVEQVEILPYHNLWESKRKQLWRKYPLHGLSSPSKNSIQKTKEILEKHHRNIIIRWL